MPYSGNAVVPEPFTGIYDYVGIKTGQCLMSKPSGSNAAVGKTAAATSYEPGHEPGRAVDGDKTTPGQNWRAANYPYTIHPGDWWQVDLGSTTVINSIVIYPDAAAWDNWCDAFHIDVSPTGAFQGEQQTIVIETNTPHINAIVYTFPSVSTRYVRLISDVTQDWVQLQEVEVYSAPVKRVYLPVLLKGYAYGEQPPTPTPTRTPPPQAPLPDKFLFAIGAQAPVGQFNGPRGVALASDGTVYVADTYNDRIQRFSATGSFLGEWGSKGNGDGQFDWPSGVAVASDGTVYVADFYNHRIQRFSATGQFLGTWGSRGSGDGRFYYPSGVSVAPDGTVFVADT
jgi:hypothetical protein